VKIVNAKDVRGFSLEWMNTVGEIPPPEANKIKNRKKILMVWLWRL